MKIAEWLINRAGATVGAEVYKQTIVKAKGLLLTPGASGVDAVKVAADMKTQGAAVRTTEAGAPVVPAAEAPAPGAPAADAPLGAPAAAAPLAAPAPGADAANAAPQGGRTRKARHQTPKRKRLSRKKSIKRK